MFDFLQLTKIGGDYKLLYDAVRGGKPAAAFALSLGARLHVAAALNRTVLYITADRLAAADSFERICAYTDNAVFIPDRDDVLLHRAASSAENISKRIDALTRLSENKADIAVMSAEAFLQFYPQAELFKAAMFTLEKGIRIERDSLVEKLIAGGYTRTERAEKGEFSVRGDIVDIYPPSFQNPVRISFFDDEIEDIRRYDAQDMQSVEHIDKITVPPASDILIDKNELLSVEKQLKALKAEGYLKDIIDDILSRLELNPNDSALVWLLPFIEGKSTILDYLPADAVVLFDEPKIIDDKLSLLEKEHKSRVKSLAEGNSVTPLHINSVCRLADLYEQAKNFRNLAFMQITSANPVFRPLAVFSFRSQPVNKYYLDRAALVSDLKNYIYSGYRVALCCGTESRAHTAADDLGRQDVMVYVSDEVGAGISATTLSIRTGFVCHSAKLVVMGQDDLYGKPRARADGRQKKEALVLNAGDYVVHDVHGVGICEGTEKLTAGGVAKDYVVLRYRDGDKLYVPIDQMNMLSRFTGGEAPRLNKIGGKEFEKLKEKVKKSVKKLAFDLMKLYAEREKQKGFVYSPDTVWQKEFEDKFEFELTDDQARAVDDIKADMEKGKLMDRLVCGDVGYGKTEVAFRAIFKTLMDSRQAAILAPTTILAKQHFNTLTARLQGFGIRCELLTRFQTAAESEQIIKGLKSGEISVVVATHRLLSRDVGFHNLGLLVLDEEQRFGVEHKEKLKLIKKDVNILTLTATPIPRTLNMALSGLRDISLLETPPKNRLPVQNYIAEYSDTLLKDALEREIRRGGQAFVLYNYVESIDAFAARVAALLSDCDAKIIVAHGQMTNAELDEKMSEFYQKQANVLVSTTIIENGIDLPDANTLIVYDADRFGLAQLYQLRGRVGRSGALAHAYFTTRTGKVLSEPAVKRLTALTEYAEFGSGFKIAMADLEIRGAGSILGAEQHGHIEKVGYDMYTKLLSQAVDEIRSGHAEGASEVEVKVEADAYINEGYVSRADKLRIYKQIAEVKNRAEGEQLIASLADIYGAPPLPLQNLILISALKNTAGKLGFSGIYLNKKGAALQCADAQAFQNKGLADAAVRRPKDVVLAATLPPRVLFNTKGRTARETLILMLEYLTEAESG